MKASVLVESGIRQRCIMFSMALQHVYGCNDERGENGVGEEGSEVYIGGETVKTAGSLVCR